MIEIKASVSTLPPPEAERRETLRGPRAEETKTEPTSANTPIFTETSNDTNVETVFIHKRGCFIDY